MADESKAKIENLELNKETLQDLTQEEGEGVHGGQRAQSDGCDATKTQQGAGAGCWR